MVVRSDSEKIVIWYPSSPEFYFRLLGASIPAPSSIEAMQIGHRGFDTFQHLLTAETTRFFRIQAVPRLSPLDADGDGIDDLWELERSTQLNPLDPADASTDPDADGRTHWMEYKAATSGLRTNSWGLTPARIITKSGSADTLGRVVTRIDSMPSMNDSGRVAFVGWRREQSGLEFPNVFVADPSEGELRPMLRTDFELPDLPLNQAPRQRFTAPSINNQNRVFAWRNLQAIIGFMEDESTESVPLTYLEEWDSGNGGNDLPIRVLASGNPGVDDTMHWVDPITAGLLPGAFETNSAWLGLPSGLATAARPSANNLGQAVFTVLRQDYTYALVTDQITQDENLLLFNPNALPAKLADDGTVVAVIMEEREERPFPTLYTATYPLLDDARPLITLQDWDVVGTSPTITDNGSAILFLGSPSLEGSSRIGVAQGPALFLAQRQDGAFKVSKVSGIETNLPLADLRLAVRDRIAAWDFNARCSAGNSGWVAFQAMNSEGNRMIRLDQFATASPTPFRIVVARIGDPIPGTPDLIKNLDLYDAVDNALEATVTFWAEGESGIQYILAVSIVPTLR